MLVKMKDICTKVGSGATPKGGNNAYIKTGISLIRSQNIHDFYFSHDGLAHINDEQAAKLNGVRLEEDDVLLNITGDSVARACKVDNSVLPARVNQHVCIVRGDKRKVLSSYVLYYLQMKKPELLMMASSGATRNALTKGMIEELELDLPSFQEQKKIVSLLDDIQCKILNNNRINRNLSEQTLAIYHKMFVETDNANRTTCRIDEYFDITIGKTPPRKEKEWFSKNPIDCVWISISDMGSCGTFITDSSEYLTRTAVDKHNVKVVPDNTVILSFKLTVGRIAITVGKTTTNEAIAHFNTSKDNITEYLYCYLKSFDFDSLGSTSSIGTAVNSKTIKAMEFVNPEEKELQEFCDIVRPMFEQIKKNQFENQYLEMLRDSLLPKLMSGELDVSDLKL